CTRPAPGLRSAPAARRRGAAGATRGREGGVATMQRMMIRASVLAFAVVLTGAAGAAAQQDAAADTTARYTLVPLVVEGRGDDLTGIAVSASQGFVGYRDFRLRPLVREGELLETVPGLIMTQHSGDGKSNQMFVRGFNLDHGTDFA